MSANIYMKLKGQGTPYVLTVPVSCDKTVYIGTEKPMTTEDISALKEIVELLKSAMTRGMTIDFNIPRPGGRIAFLRVEYPLTKQDITHIRKWLDILENTLEDEEAPND